METQSEALVETLESLKNKGYDYLKKITAIDRGDALEVLYIVYGTETKKEEIISVRVPTNDAKVPTVMKVYRGADWYERELSEMFGIKIEGRRAPRLLLEEWDGADAPLRKSFVWGMPKDKGGYSGIRWK